MKPKAKAKSSESSHASKGSNEPTKKKGSHSPASAGVPRANSDGVTKRKNYKSVSSGNRKSTSDEYAKKKYDSNTDDFKKKALEQAEKEMSREQFSPMCYVGMIVFLVFLNILMYVLFSVFLPKPTNRMEFTGRVPTRELTRMNTVVMTENLDCSIYLKLLAIRDRSIRESSVSVLVCLTMMENHTMSLDYDDHIAAQHLFRYSIETKKGGAGCERDATNDTAVKANDTCLNDTTKAWCPYECLQTGHLAVVESTQTDRHRFYDQLFINIDPNLTTHFEEWMRGSTDTNYRVFPVSKINDERCVAAMDRIEPRNQNQWSAQPTKCFTRFEPDWDEIGEDGQIDIEGTKTANETSIRRGPKKVELHNVTSLELMKKAFSINADRQRPIKLSEDLQAYFRLQWRPADEIYFESPFPFELRFPRQRSASTLSAFVVAAVCRKMFQLRINAEDNAQPFDVEKAMYTNVELAMRTAYSKFDDLFDGSNRLNLIMFRKLVDDFENSAPASPKEFKYHFDRVSSTLQWRGAGKDEVLVIDTGKKSNESEHDGMTSLPASASLIINARLQGVMQPLMVVTASGSSRTVEAVAITMLRMLVLREYPGDAVMGPGIYYHYASPKSPKFYCDMGNKNERDIIASTLNVGGKRCRGIVRLRKHTFWSENTHDRGTMAARKRAGVDKGIHAALDPRMVGYNYPTGF